MSTNLAQQYGKLGFVYVLSSPSVRGVDGYPLLKIGCTRKHPIQRAKELGGSSVPAPFKVMYYRDFADAFLAEGLLHKHFADRRVNDQREFFAVPLAEAITVIDKLAMSVEYREGLSSEGVIGGEYPTMSLPFSELFATFPDDGDDRQLTATEQMACRYLESTHSYARSN